MKKAYLLFLLLFSLNSYSQEYKKWSLEANYPVPADNNFIGRNYLGLVDIGVKYRFLEVAGFRFGAGLNAGILKFNNPDDFEHYLLFCYTLQPKLFVEFVVPNQPEFRPFVYAGYSFMIFRADGTNYTNDLYYSSQTLSGFNIGLGLAYDILDIFFIQLQYDFAKLEIIDLARASTSYDTNVNLFKFGVGVNL